MAAAARRRARAVEPRADLPEARRHDHPAADRRCCGCCSAFRKPPAGSRHRRSIIRSPGGSPTGIEVVVKPIGFNRDIALALIPAMAAREVAVAAIGTVYAIDNPDSDPGRRGDDPSNLRGRWSLPTALAFLMWFVFAPQCISTIAVTRRETNGWKWPAFMVGYLFALAYVAAGATYWVATCARSCRRANHGGQRQQGHSRRQSRARPGEHAASRMAARWSTCASPRPKLEGPQHRRAQGKDRMAFGRDLQRRPRQRRRALSAQGHRRSISRASCRPANGRMRRARTDIRPRSCCRASTAC